LAGFDLSDVKWIRFSSSKVMAKRRNLPVISAAYTR
jgi:hypothetical protein